MNVRANEKTKKYQFLFSNGDEDVKRYFFISDESTIGVDELGFQESRLDHNGAAAIASGTIIDAYPD
jgi:hypothetical protein